MADVNLFRQQALAHAARHSIAAGVVRQPRWAVRWLAPLVLSVLFAGVWLALQPYTDSVRVQGYLARPGGEVILRSPVSGVVADFSAPAGIYVARGDRLLVIDDSRYSAAHNETANEAVLLREALATQKQQLQLQLTQVAGLVDLDSQRVAAELGSLKQDVVLLRKERALGVRLLEQARSERIDAELLARDGHLARVDLHTIERREAQQEASLLKIQRALASAQHETVLLEQQRLRSSLESDVRSARLRSELATLTREQALLPGRRQAIVAPISGIVRAVRVASGGGVERQQALLTIVDDGAPLIAELPVPSRAVTSVHPGQRVQLRYSGFAHQRYGSFPGTVLSVTAAPTTVVPASAAGRQAPLQGTSVYRVRIAPDSPAPLIAGRRRDLPVGMQVEVDLLGDSRPLWMWLLEPILALRGKLT